MTTHSEPRAHRLIIIDDNPAIHADIEKILCGSDGENEELDRAKALLFGEAVETSPRDGFELDSAFQGQEGLAMVEKATREGRPYAVAFVDIRMPPGWDGVETVRNLWKDHPDLQVVICTAYSDYSWEEMIQQLGQSPNLVVLKKPFDNIEVLQLAHAMSNKWELNRQVRSQLENLDALVRQRTVELMSANEQLQREIAARVETESILRLSEERFVKAFNASPIALAIQRLQDGALIDANEAFLALLSEERHQVVGRSPGQLGIWPDEELQSRIERSISNRETLHNHPCVLQSLDQRQHQTLLSLELFDSGAGPHVLFIVQDVTEQLKLEEQLRQSQKMEAVGQLAAGVAHDFNNILTAVHGHTSMLQAQLAGQPACARSLTVISLAAERATRLVRQLLTFSRKQVLKPQLLQLDHVAQGLADLLKRTLGAHIQLEILSEPSLPAVEADLSMMEQIVINLCVNARDAMPRGGRVSIRLRPVHLSSADVANKEDFEPGNYVCLSVTDTGCGIPSENLNRIFDPFFTTKEIGKGTGLGLATVYGIVKQHSGSIEVESEVGRGTAFHVFLPASSARESAADPASPAPTETSSGSECILVVEDEEAVRAVATLFLRANGYRVIEAASGAEAFDTFCNRKDEIDLLFTDLMMPGSLLGDELARKVQAIKPNLPVLFTSGYSPELSQFQQQHESQFLSKPFTPVQLLESVRRCLNRSKQAPQTVTT